MKLEKILNLSEELLGKVKKYPLVTRLAVLSLAVIYPCPCYLGGFPAMNEGVYAWTSVTYNHNPDFPENTVTNSPWVGYDVYRHKVPTDTSTDK